MAATRKQTATKSLPNWILTYDAQAFGNSDVIIAAPAYLQSIIASEQVARSALYLQLFDAAAVPSNSAVPSLAPIILGAGSTIRIAMNDMSGNGYDGIACSTGVCWAASTTAGTLTQDATSSVWVTARYIA